MAAIKLLPAVLIVWLIANRRYRAAAGAVVTGAAITVAGIVLAGTDVTLEYLRVVIPGTTAMGLSPAAILAMPWITYVLLAVGVGVILARRSFAAAVFTVVFGSPAIGVASLAMIGAALRPGLRQDDQRCIES